MAIFSYLTQSQVLKAVLHGDSVLFREHPELLDALVRVYFHSSSRKYNGTECWGPLKNAAEVKHHTSHVTSVYSISSCWYMSYQAEPIYYLLPFQSTLKSTLEDIN